MAGGPSKFFAALRAQLKPEPLFCWVFRGFAWLDDFRHRHPVWTKILFTAPLSALLIYVLHVHIPALRSTAPILGPVNWGIKIVVSLIVSELFLRGIVPIQRYAWQATSMREMGLHWVITTPGKYCTTVSRLLEEHPKEERVRVICISGKYLFVERETFEGESTPLYDFAQRGMLDVIMPRGGTGNPTVIGRFDTYDEDFKKKHRYNSVADLEAEIAFAKTELAYHTRNTVKEHDVLCMWRVVLLQNFCVVQSYFPNPHGKDSNSAPIFVFKKHENSGYYATFENMFGLVKKYGERT